MVLANVTHFEEVSSAEDFFKVNPYTIKELINLFEVNEEDIKKRLRERELMESDEEIDFDYLFLYLNEEVEMCDEEMIEKILETREEKYFITFDEETGCFDIYEVKE